LDLLHLATWKPTKTWDAAKPKRLDEHYAAHYTWRMHKIIYLPAVAVLIASPSTAARAFWDVETHINCNGDARLEASNTPLGLKYSLTLEDSSELRGILAIDSERSKPEDHLTLFDSRGSHLLTLTLDRNAGEKVYEGKVFGSTKSGEALNIGSMICRANRAWPGW
jgi:hypothetical protein